MFPGDNKRLAKHRELYSEIKEILEKAKVDTSINIYTATHALPVSFDWLSSAAKIVTSRD